MSQSPTAARALHRVQFPGNFMQINLFVCLIACHISCWTALLWPWGPHRKLIRGLVQLAQIHGKNFADSIAFDRIHSKAIFSPSHIAHHCYRIGLLASVVSDVYVFASCAALIGPPGKSKTWNTTVRPRIAKPDIKNCLHVMAPIAFWPFCTVQISNIRARLWLVDVNPKLKQDRSRAIHHETELNKHRTIKLPTHKCTTRELVGPKPKCKVYQARTNRPEIKTKWTLFKKVARNKWLTDTVSDWAFLGVKCELFLFSTQECEMNVRFFESAIYMYVIPECSVVLFLYSWYCSSPMFKPERQ